MSDLTFWPEPLEIGTNCRESRAGQKKRMRSVKQCKGGKVGGRKKSLEEERIKGQRMVQNNDLAVLRSLSEENCFLSAVGGISGRGN